MVSCNAMPCGDVQVPNSNAGLISGGVFGDEWPSPIQCWNGFEISGDATPRCELHEDDTTPTWTIPECLPQQCSNPSGTFGDTIPVECEDGHAPVLDGIPWTLGGDSCHWPVEILQNTFFRSSAPHWRSYYTARILIPAECPAVLWQDDARGPFLAPTVVDDPDPASALMQSEIFGPILPIVTVGSAAEAVAFVNARARPLALYVFAADADAERVVAATTSGGACVNDTIFQISNPHLPFGGVGASGMGRYHGKNGFDELSHARLFLFYRFVAPDACGPAKVRTRKLR